MRFLLIFVDGLGLGENNPHKNPLVTAHMPVMRGLLNGLPMTASAPLWITDDVNLLAADCTMKVKGLPQSATGQTALFTGINAAKQLGRHIPAFPGPQLKEIIDAHSILKRVQEAGKRSTSANAYAPNYFDLIAARKRRHSATTLTILAAQIPLRTDIQLLRDGRAVYQDITNAKLVQMGFEVPEITPGAAGRNLSNLAAEYDLTLFEYFETDISGHTCDMDQAQRSLEKLDEFLGGLLQGLDFRKTVLIVTSDHGNIEDMSVKTHTFNPVPVLMRGPQDIVRDGAESIRSITDIAPWIYRQMNAAGNH